MNSMAKQAVLARIGDARNAVNNSDRNRAYAALEEAHVLAQSNGLLHAWVHWHMLLLAWQFAEFPEIIGQLGRLAVAAPASWSGRYPRGNVGTTRVSAFAPMAIPPSLASIMEPPPGSAHYIPALRFHGLTRFYDKLVAWTCGERQWKPRLVALLAVSEKEAVLDVGCGTGTLSIALAQAKALVTGIDADRSALSIAEQKKSDAGVQVLFQQADARKLPYDAGHFDCAVSSLFFHHLESSDKFRVLQEIGRVTKPGGRIVVADWSKPSGLLRSLGFRIVRMLDGAKVTQDHANGRIDNCFDKAGFTNVQKFAQFQVPLGAIAIWTMARPQNDWRSLAK